jgi:hypothetical protein
MADLGILLCMAEALNRLGELSLRTSATGQARDQHTRALAIARDIGAAPEEARALEGLGQAHLHDGHRGHAAAHLQQALAIYLGPPPHARGRHQQRVGLVAQVWDYPRVRGDDSRISCGIVSGSGPPPRARG